MIALRTMVLRLLLPVACGCGWFLTAFVIAASPSPGYPPCYICGSSDNLPNNNDAIVQFPGQPAVTCGSLQLGAISGYVEQSICSVFAAFGVPQICGCNATASSPVPAPINMTTTPTYFSNNTRSSSPQPASTAPQSSQTSAVKQHWHINPFTLIIMCWSALLIFLPR